LADVWRVRPETPADAGPIEAVNVAAFGGRPNEAALVGAIRASPGFVADLSLVAEADGAVIGHVMLSGLELRDGDARHPALVLAPLAVAPRWQRCGVGSALVRHALAAAQAAGHRAVVLLGAPAYYRRFGFEPSAAQGIAQPFRVGDASQVVFLDPDARGQIKGVVEYPEPFHTVPGVLP
jgi:putative acetyltransferase